MLLQGEVDSTKNSKESTLTAQAGVKLVGSFLVLP